MCMMCDDNIEAARPMKCPRCTHVFRGLGWEGIDAHWDARHLDICSYDAFWSQLCRKHKSGIPE
jgi:hypothetical protein